MMGDVNYRWRDASPLQFKYRLQLIISHCPNQGFNRLNTSFNLNIKLIHCSIHYKTKGALYWTVDTLSNENLTPQTAC